MRGDEIPFGIKIEKRIGIWAITFCIFILDANETNVARDQYSPLGELKIATVLRPITN